MFVVGLTGGIGSGKTEVANLFAKKGINIIDSDQIAHELSDINSPAFKSLVDHFGEVILTAEGTLNRKLLRQIVFNDPQEKEWLESLLHPLIREIMRERAVQSHSPYSIAVIPLLFENQTNPLINRILVVDTTVENQIKRALARDSSMAIDTIEKIIKSQVSREIRIKRADDIILNNGSLSELMPQVDRLHEHYLQLAIHHS